MLLKINISKSSERKKQNLIFVAMQSYLDNKSIVIEHLFCEIFTGLFYRIISREESYETLQLQYMRIYCNVYMISKGISLDKQHFRYNLNVITLRTTSD